ncbi:hypothetical protein [Rhizobium sp.]|uniref:hypothetical protein n=1 Tax=Rhizobium sp. TaxID=391 RepID=UPI002AA60B71
MLPTSVWSVHQSAATCIFPISKVLEDFEIHLGSRFYTGNFAGDLGPVPVFMEITLPSAAQRASLRLIVSAGRIQSSKQSGVNLPPEPYRSTVTYPSLEKWDHN